MVLNLCVYLLVALGPIYSQEEFIEGRYMLQPLGSTRYLDVSGSCEHLNGCKVQLYGLGKSPKNNTFLIRRSKDILRRNYYNIICVSNNKALDADYLNIREEGCKIQAWDLRLDFKGNQDWRIIPYLDNSGRTDLYTFRCGTTYAQFRCVGVLTNQINRNKTQVALYSDNNRNATIVWALTRVN